jgi:ribosomal protein S6
MSKTYELFLILDGKRDDNAAQKSIREIEAILQKNEAKIIKNLNGTNARLAAPINGKADTYQLTLEVEAKPASLVEITRQLKLSEDILRLVFFSTQGV